MKRRAAIGLFALVASGGCLGRLPGPTGPRNPPDREDRPTGDGPGGDVSVESFDAVETDGGDLRVTGTVRNEGGRTVSRTVTVAVTVDGEEHVRTTEVRVPAGETATFAVTFDVSYEAFTADGSVSVTV